MLSINLFLIFFISYKNDINVKKDIGFCKWGVCIIYLIIESFVLRKYLIN